MSYDLYMVDGVHSVDEVQALLDSPQAGPESASPKIRAALDELIGIYPADTEDEWESSPWSSWPLIGNLTGGGRVCALNLRPSAPDDVTDQILAVFERHGLALYDPQSDDLFSLDAPSEPPPKRPFWKRFFR